MDVEAVEAAAKTGAGAVREGNGPLFPRVPDVSLSRALDVRSGALSDQGRSRGMEEARPDSVFRQRLQGRGLLTDEEFAGLERDVADEVSHAVAFAEAGSLEPVTALTRFVYSERRA